MTYWNWDILVYCLCQTTFYEYLLQIYKEIIFHFILPISAVPITYSEQVFNNNSDNWFNFTYLPLYSYLNNILMFPTGSLNLSDSNKIIFYSWICRDCEYINYNFGQIRFCLSMTCPILNRQIGNHVILFDCGDIVSFLNLDLIAMW